MPKKNKNLTLGIACAYIFGCFVAGLCGFRDLPPVINEIIQIIFLGAIGYVVYYLIRLPF